MTILNLVESSNPLLKQELPLFNFQEPPTDPAQLARDLTETMINEKGIGLAANQCGLPYRAFVLSAQQVIACFNPRIVDFSPEQVYIEEGCLSYPGLYVKIRRPASIRARYTQPNGETVTKTFEGLTARCFQHELDHLNGVVHIDRASKFHKEQAFNRLKRLSKIKR